MREQPSPPQTPSQAAESVADSGYSLAIGIVVLLLAILIFLFVARSAMKRKKGQKPVPRAMPGRGVFKQKFFPRRPSNLAGLRQGQHRVYRQLSNLQKEQKAAAQYYAGSYWRTRGMGYASSVLSFATQYQKDIDFLGSI